MVAGNTAQTAHQKKVSRFALRLCLALLVTVSFTAFDVQTTHATVDDSLLNTRKRVVNYVKSLMNHTKVYARYVYARTEVERRAAKAAMDKMHSRAEKAMDNVGNGTVTGEKATNTNVSNDHIGQRRNTVDFLDETQYDFPADEIEEIKGEVREFVDRDLDEVDRRIDDLERRGTPGDTEKAKKLEAQQSRLRREIEGLKSGRSITRGRRGQKGFIRLPSRRDLSLPNPGRTLGWVVGGTMAAWELHKGFEDSADYTVQRFDEYLKTEEGQKACVDEGWSTSCTAWLLGESLVNGINYTVTGMVDQESIEEDVRDWLHNDVDCANTFTACGPDIDTVMALSTNDSCINGWSAACQEQMEFVERMSAVSQFVPGGGLLMDIAYPPDTSHFDEQLPGGIRDDDLDAGVEESPVEDERDAGVEDAPLIADETEETEPESQSDRPEAERADPQQLASPQPTDPEPTAAQPNTPDYQVMGDQDNPPQVAEVPEDIHSCLAFSCGDSGSLEDGIGWNVDWDGLPEWQQEIEAGGNLSCQATCLANYGYTEGSGLADGNTSNWQTEVKTQNDIDQMSGAVFSPNPTDSVNSSYFHEEMSFTDFDKGTKVDFEQSPGAGGTVSVTDSSGTQVAQELPDNWRQASVTAPDGTTYSFERGVDTPNTRWTVEKPDGTVQTGGGPQIEDTPQQNYSIDPGSSANQSTSAQSAGGTGVATGTSTQNQAGYSQLQSSSTSSGHPTSSYGTNSSQGPTGTASPSTDGATSQKGSSGSQGGRISPGTASEYSQPSTHKDVGAPKSEIAPRSSGRSGASTEGAYGLDPPQNMNLR